MKKYTIAINSFVFTISLLIGIGTVYMVIQPVSITASVNGASYMSVIGNVKEITDDAYLFEYLYEGKKWLISIQINDQTIFRSSRLTVKDSVVYGRTLTLITRNDIEVGTRVIVDWIAVSGEGYIAIDITKTDITNMDQSGIFHFTK